jgi:MFS family permease
MRGLAAIRRTFGSLDTRNFRLYFTGDLVSYTGSWMQNMAEAWLVFELTGSGAAVGATFAFRFLPVAIFGLWGGAIADHFDRRKLLLLTSSLAALLAVALWFVVLSDVVTVWIVFGLATALGFVTVVDEPARQAFIEEMVGRERLANAVALNSAVHNSARITGPAMAGLLIAGAGVAWVFFVNALTFFAFVAALLLMRKDELRPIHRHEERPRVREGLRYAWSLTDIRMTIVLVAVVGTLVYNFPTYLTLLASETFGGGAGLAGFLMAMLGIGMVTGGLVAAHRGHATRRIVIIAALFLGGSMVVVSLLPALLLVEIALVPVGVLAVFFGTSANAHMQLASAHELRGRVMAIYMLLTLGTTVVGGPFVGWVCQQVSPRFGMGMAGAVTMVAAALGAVRTVRRRASTVDEPSPVRQQLAPAAGQ